MNSALVCCNEKICFLMLKIQVLAFILFNICFTFADLIIDVAPLSIVGISFDICICECNAKNDNANKRDIQLGYPLNNSEE